MQTFPRVLFITPVAFNPYAGGGATYTSLFTGWPKDRLATIHNDVNPTTTDICDNYFVLGPAELDFFEPFGWLRRRLRSSSAFVQKPESATDQLLPARPSRARWVDAGRKRLLGDSIPERSALTPELHKWIAEYKPDVIYTILGSNGMMELIERIRSTFHLPLVVHIMDDWATSAHRYGLFSPIERVRMNRWLQHFFATASAHLGISPAMSAAYSKRYKRPFTAFQYTLDVERWMTYSKQKLESSHPPEFLYIGSIFPDAQLQSLIDCAQAILELNEEGYTSRLRIVTSADNIARYSRLLALHPNITLEVSQFDEPSFYNLLANADALLLPVNFDQKSVDFIRYSMPTKVPSYLISGTPCLVYGSSETAQVRYAMDDGWGHVVTQHSMTALKAALRRIADDLPLRRNLSAAARGTSAKHDARLVRPAFQNILRNAAENIRAETSNTS